MDDLFILIKSLSDADKKFFRQYASLQSEDGNYIRLFNFIDNLDTYHDNLVLEHFKKEVFVKQLSVAKNYLNTVILRTFRLSAEKESPEIALQLLMMDIRFLLSKKCLGQLKKTLKRAKKNAEEQENFLVLMNIYAHQRHLFTEFKFEGREGVTLANIALEESDTLKKLENVNLIYHLYSDAKFILSTERETAAPQAIKIKFKEIFDHPLMQDQKTALSLRAKHWYHSAKHFKYIFFPDLIADENNCKQHLQLFLDNPVFTNARTLSYMTVINNMLEVLRDKNKTEEALPYLTLLNLVKTNNERDESGKQIYLAHHYMWYYLRSEQYNKANEIADGELLRLKQFSKLRKDSIIIQQMLIAIVFIMADKPEKANTIIQTLLAIPKTGIREDLLEHAKLLYLIIQCQFEHFDIANNLLRSIKRSEIKYPLISLVSEYYTLFLKNPAEFKANNDKQNFVLQLAKVGTSEFREFPEMINMLQKVWSV